VNVGIVLAGGMAKGAYQIGALKAIAEFLPRDEIKYMSCSSVGVLNGYAFATDNLEAAERMWRNVCGENNRVMITKMLRSATLQQDIKNIYDPEKTLPCVCYCSLLDLNHRNLIYQDLSTVESELIPLYLKASVAMPVYNRAVQIGDVSYFDGAMIDNIPVYPLLKHTLDYIICIYFDDTCYKFESTYVDNKIIKITFPCDSIVKESLIFKPEWVERMLRDGYDRTKELLEPVFAKGHDNLDHIYQVIERRNQEKENNSLRVTGDMLTTNLNKITQKLTKKKIL